MKTVKDRVIFARKQTRLSQKNFCKTDNRKAKIGEATLKVVELGSDLSDNICNKLVNRLEELGYKVSKEWILTGVGELPRKISDIYERTSHEAISERLEFIINFGQLTEKDYVLDYTPPTVQAWRAGKRGGISKEYADKLANMLAESKKIYFDSSWLLYGIGSAPTTNKDIYLSNSEYVCACSDSINNKLQ
jgi:hypothetical protein